MADERKPSRRVAKIELIGGQAKPGPALASLGINMAQFTKDFNDKTKDRNGEVVPVQFTILPNKSFTFVLRTTPTPILLKAAAKIEKGASSQRDTVAEITGDQIQEIAKYKLPDSNAGSLEAMVRMVEGTARQMGIRVC